MRWPWAATWSLGLDGFDLGDMGLIEGDEEFEEDFQEPSTFYDGTPSAFKASAGHKTDLLRWRIKQRLTEIRAVKHYMGRKIECGKVIGRRISNAVASASSSSKADFTLAVVALN